MKQLFYTFRYLIRNKTNAFIRITSLSLGLLVGILLFARVAFEMSFDKSFKDVDQLYSMMVLYTIGGEAREPIPIVHAPMPSALNADFPQVQYATVTSRPYKDIFVYGDKRYSSERLNSDSLFFKTLGIDVLLGDDRLLGVENNLFISQKLAKTVFGDKDPRGEVLIFNNDQHYTVQGVFKNIPENTHFQVDVVGAIGHYIYNPRLWGGGDSFWGYVRLYPDADPKQIDEGIPAWIRKYRDEDARIQGGFVSDYYLTPVIERHSGNESIRRMCLILSLLAFAILIVACMNYILISISSLASRAKSVGIHKCSGASSGNIFSLFLNETAILVIVSLLFSIVLLLVFRGPIEDITNTSFSGLFNAANLWVPLVVVGLLFLFAGFLPARIFAHIPVTQVFRTTTANKRYWKRILLFIQFSGITFIMVLLVIILSQYRMIINQDLGYNPDGILTSGWVNMWSENEEERNNRIDMTKNEFANYPFVTDVAVTQYSITSNYSGNSLLDEEGNTLFTVRVNEVDYNYISSMDMELILGENFTAPEQLIVNETFVKLRGWDDSPLGKRVVAGGHTYGTIVGVVKDFPISSLYSPQTPVMLIGVPHLSYGILTLRVTDLTSARLTELNNKLAELYPTQYLEFDVLKNEIDSQYRSTRQFRDSVIAAFIVVLLITFMGLIGYISDEILHRSKEIAIRKVNGATAKNILELLSKEISFLSIPAIVIGLLIALIVGRNWLEEFAVKIPLTPLLFILSGLVILLVILIIVTVRTWKVANENPVHSIKVE